MRRLATLLFALAVLAFGWGPACAQQIVGGASGAAAPAVAGTPTVGQVLTVPTYPGVTIQWTRDGAAISAATAFSYTLVSADGGTTVNAVLTLTGVSVAGGGGGGGALDFSVAGNSSLLSVL